MVQEYKYYSKDVGDESQYFVNYLAIFGELMSVKKIKAISKEAALKRVSEIDSFENTWNKKNRQLETISHQDANSIRKTHAAHKRLLIAMFHYGSHRQIMLELSEHLIQTTFPFAKGAYQNAMADIAKNNAEKGKCYQLLDVESRNVGLQLARAIRRGRIGLIYVDGNLGPEGASMDKEDTIVSFFHREMKVKSGIARLAHSCDAAILPIFAGGKETPKLHIGKVIASPRHNSQKLTEEELSQFSQSTMQSIYDELERIVHQSPSDWEFAFCLHRWLVPKIDATENLKSISLAQVDSVSINEKRFVPYSTSDKWYFVDVDTQKAISLPSWAAPLAQVLNYRPRASVAELINAVGESPERTQSILSELCERNILQGLSVKKVQTF
ncbi:hypothetical protein FLL45_12600 [Aliikangiella marina]|uniref:Lysophospholipid acyltransferase family protein n=1 Tax=Aliikangiella marina TaxID=1712262 RepID=A0A545T942_9GAMM|nr:hypothetical protein [Aliikangiella marina]TQV73705.1 hypothetical protein FLL45_12600 [Aliikangiella marina]